jgi:iron complex outermembrane receptor protein
MKLNPLYLAMSASLFASTSVLAQTQDQPQDQEKQGYALENVKVTGQALGRYAITDASSTTRSNVSIMDTARSIQVLGRDFIDDADIQSLEEALDYVSGTGRRQRQGGIDTQYYIRGFKEQDTYRNSKRELSSKTVNMTTVETVDVLKGPASVQFGVNAPGGIVNYTTKKPQAQTLRSIKVRVDEHGKKEIIGDFTGELNKSGTVLYRFITAGEDSESVRDFSERKTSTIAPSLTFLLGHKTELTAAYELHHTELPIDRGIPIGEINGSYVLADVPVERKFSEPGDKSTDDTQSFDMTLTHQFNGDWQGELSYSYQLWDSSFSDVSLEEFDIVTGDTKRQSSGIIDAEQESHQGSALLHGDFELMDIQHKVTLGIDYDTADFEGLYGEGVIQPFGDFNLYAPVYGEISTELTPADDDTETRDSKGLFISETVYLGSNLIVNLASRYDYYDYEYSEKYYDGSEGYFSKEKDEALTWNAGLLYKVVPAASVYLSYATSYEPNSAADLVGELKPQEGEQWEVGIKGLAINDTLQYSLVYYDITKSNIPNDFEIDDPASADPSDTLDIVKLIGEQTSKGLELDVTWQATDDFSLLASYAYNDAEISKNDEDLDLVDNTLDGVAEHSTALFMSYTLTPMLAGLSVMGGVKHVEDVPNRIANEYMIPGSTVYDLGLKYALALSQGDTLSMQAGFKNVTDERVYIPQRKDAIGIGQARTLYANLEYQF